MGGGVQKGVETVTSFGSFACGPGKCVCVSLAGYVSMHL